MASALGGSVEASTSVRPVVVVALTVIALLPIVLCLVFYRRYGRMPDPRRASAAEFKKDLQDFSENMHKVVKTLKRSSEDPPPKAEERRHEWVERSFLRFS